MAACNDAEMAGTRFEDAVSKRERKEKEIEVWKQKYSHELKPWEPNDERHLLAAVQAREGLVKLYDQRTRAARAAADMGLELEVTIDKWHATCAIYDRCEAALAERSAADASG